LEKIIFPSISATEIEKEARESFPIEMENNGKMEIQLEKNGKEFEIYIITIKS